MELKHLTKDEGAVKTRWIIDLVQACMDTPSSTKGESVYGCTVEFIDMQAEEDPSSSWIGWIWNSPAIGTGSKSSVESASFP